MPSTFSRTLRSLEGDGPRRGIVLAAGALSTVWLAWFLVARVPIYEVAESARLEVKAAAHPVAAQVDGRVLVTHLAIGWEVQAREILVVLDSEEQRLALRESRTRRDGFAAKLEALRVQITAEQEAASKHRAARSVAIGELRAKVEESEARAKYAEFQLAALAKLRARNAASPEEYQHGRAEAEALRAAVKTNQLAVERLEREREVAGSDRQVRIAGLESDAVELAGHIAVEEATARRLEHAIELRNVRAPVSGRVGEVVPEFREGSVVRAGVKLGSIIPPGGPRAVAMFPVAAVGRIQPQQPARLRLHGFPWTQYGTVRARVTDVGNEASGGLIRVELSLMPHPYSPIPIAHGLPGTAEVEIERVTPAVLVLRATGRYLAARRISAIPSNRSEP
jgi:membrane fusion protein (multidrug efflux system)